MALKKISYSEMCCDIDICNVEMKRILLDGIRNNSSRLLELERKYKYLFESQLKSKFMKKGLLEDDISSFIIEDQNLDEFIPNGMKPASVTADGNCLYNAASTFIVGDESLSQILRVLTSIELFRENLYYKSEFDKIFGTENKHFKNEKSFFKASMSFETGDKIVNDEDISKAIQSEAIYNCKNSKSASLLCIAALSSVTKSCIYSVYTPRKNVKLFLTFTRMFTPRTEIINKSFTLLWVTTKNKENYDNPNHFVVLLPKFMFSSDTVTVKETCTKIDTLNTTKTLSESKDKSNIYSYFTSSSIPTRKILDETKSKLPAVGEIKVIENSTKRNPSTISSTHTTHKRAYEKISTNVSNDVESKVKKQETYPAEKNKKHSFSKGDVKIVRGMPLKTKTECHPNDIGLHFKTIRDMPDVQKYSLIKNIWRPHAKYQFPQHTESNRKWRFNYKYIDQNSSSYYPWLVYSAYYDGVFCLPCLVFGHEHCHTQLSKLFKEPFTRWNGGPTRWKEHQQSGALSMHSISTAKYQTFINQMEGREKRIENIADSASSQRIKNNRKKIKPILETIVLCGQQNISLRGHRDNLNDHEDKTNNVGNFQRLLDFRIEAGDEILKDHFITAPRNATYRSSVIQNEMISSCKKYLQQKLLAEIKGKYFAIIADEASDSSNTEQLSLVLRFIDDKGEIREEFMEYLSCPSMKGESIAEMILDRIENHYHLDMNLCRGQCYDGASNMSGIHAGVAAIILKKYPKALYFHCSSHRLNLVVASNCQTTSVRNMMDTIKKTSDVFHFSAKKQLVLSECITNMMPDENRKKLLDVCRTRWITRLDGMQRFQEMLRPIIESLELIGINWDQTYHTEARSIANGLVHSITSFDFIINLLVVRHILSYVHPLTFELQKQKLDILSVYEAVDNCLKALRDCRVNIDEKFNEWFQIAKHICEDNSIPIKKPRTAKIQKHRENHESDDIEQFYKRSLTIPFLDNVISELDRRFSSEHRILMKAFCLLPSFVLRNKNWKICVKKLSLESIVDLPNPLSLTEEMELWENYWSNTSSKGNFIPDTVAETLKAVVQKKEWFPNLYSLLEHVGTVPSSSNSCERSISKLRLLKTYLRSTMNIDRLNGLALLYAHRDIKIDYDELLNIFARDYSHRLQLINILNDTSE